MTVKVCNSTRAVVKVGTLLRIGNKPSKCYSKTIFILNQEVLALKTPTTKQTTTRLSIPLSKILSITTPNSN